MLSVTSRSACRAMACRALRNRLSGHTARAVAAGDEVAADDVPFPGLRSGVGDGGPLGVESVQRDVRDAEVDGTARFVRVGAEQVSDQQLLRIDVGVLPGQAAVAEDVPGAAQPKLALALELGVGEQAAGEAVTLQRPHHPLLDDARPGPLLDELPARGLQNDAVHPGGAQQPADGQPGHPGAHDHD